MYPYASIPHPIRSSSSVVFYLRYDLTADYRTSPVPAILHFYFLFIPLHSISFHFLMFERFMIQCILYDTSHKSLEHTTLIYIISGFKLSFLHTILFYIRRLLICNCTHSSILPALHPSYFRSFLSYFPHPILSTSAVVFYRRYDLTADYRTSPVPAISTFISFFITFIS